MKLYAKTDVGLKRATNQDAFCAMQPENGIGFLVLCDGMGGHRGGNVASELAVRGFSRQLRKGLDPSLRPKDLKTFLHTVVERVNGIVLNAALKTENLSGMGSTVVAAIRCGKKFCILHVGDSRAYLLREQKLTRLTKDHSLVQEMIDRGELTPEEAEQHPYRHVITRVLGAPLDYEPQITVSDIRPGDLVLLCSDGLTNVADDGTLEKLLCANAPQDLPEVLIRKALDGGGPDNVTVGILYEEQEATE